MTSLEARGRDIIHAYTRCLKADYHKFYPTILNPLKILGYLAFWILKIVQTIQKLFKFLKKIFFLNPQWGDVEGDGEDEGEVEGEVEVKVEGEGGDEVEGEGEWFPDWEVQAP